MFPTDLINEYLEGWRLGDGAMSLATTTEAFFYEDPNTGLIERENFVRFVEDFKEDARQLNKGVLPAPFLTYTNIVFDRQTEPATAWCWWQATGTPLQGAALIRFSSSGVESERIAYFSRLPE
jgi:hypothetical protein